MKGREYQVKKAAMALISAAGLAGVFCANGADAAAGASLPDPLFVCDWDSPVRLNGTVLALPVSEDRVVEGRHGKGFHFAPRVHNQLPYALSTLSTNVADGVFEAKDLCVKAETRWRSFFRDAHVASAWVKGRKGSRLEMKVLFSPTGIKRATLERKWAQTVKSRDKTATDARVVEDEIVPVTVELTGGWQRVAAYSIMDARRHHNRRVSFRLASADAGAFEMRRLQYEVQQRSPRKGGNPAPGIWVEGGRASEPAVCTIDLAKHGVEFPYSEGSLSLWVRYPELSNLRPTFLSFFLWDRIDLGEDSFFPGRGAGRRKSPLDKTDSGWQHVVFTWTPTNAVFYLNGRETDRMKRHPGKGPAPVSLLRIGGAGWAGRQMCDLVLDDAALFAFALSPADAARIASSPGPVAPVGRRWFAENVGCTLFHRNEREARAAFTVHVPEKCSGEFILKVGAHVEERRVYDLEKGANLVIVPFDARRFPAGRTPFSLTGTQRTGLFRKNVRRLTLAGDFEILPRFDRDAYRIFNWGGSVPIPEEYALEAGMNVMHLPCDVSSGRLDALQRKGVHYALNLANCADAFNTGFDEKKIKRNLTARLRRHVGRANWTMSMASTEAAGIRNTDRAVNMPKWVDFAHRSLGRDPKARVCGPAFSLNRPRGWKAPSDGVIDIDDDLGMLLWAEREGDPVLQVNRMDREVVHALSPGNIVWAEPSCPYGVDMTAYWAYEYPLDRVVSRLKRSYSAARDAGTAFMPTLCMGSCPTLSGEIPGFKGKVHLSHTYDELLLKTYAVMGVTRAHAMSYFDLCGWSEGEKHADRPVAGKHYAQKGVGRRFGDKLRRDVVPALMLLQDMDTYDSPDVAVVLSETTDHTSGVLWTYRGYIFDVTRILFDVIPECTVLRDATVGKARGFRHVFLPSASSVLRANHDALVKAARGGTTLYTDFLCRQSYPGAVRFDDGLPKTNYVNNYKSLLSQMAPSFKRLRALALSIRREGREKSPAYVEESDGVLRVYPRISNGECNTFLCVNDTRRAGPFSTYRAGVKDYLPYGKACKSTVSFKVPQGSHLYDFFTSKKVPFEYRDGRAFVKLDLGPAEAALICVYPAGLEKLSIGFSRTGDEREGVLTVELRDADGNLAKGRQLIDLTVSDAAGPRDESGLYRLMDGRCRVPVYFPVGARDVKLTARAVERVSGLVCETSGF